MGGGDGGPSPGQMSPAGITPEPVMTETVVPANYWPKGVDQGITDPSLGFRALMVFQVKAPTALSALIDSLYQPGTPAFRQYLSYDTWMAEFSPSDADIAAVREWIESAGMQVVRVARNNLMLEYVGTVAKWNAAFGTELHTILRTAGTWRNPAYAPVTDLQVPQALIGRIKRVLLPDIALDGTMLTPDDNPIVNSLPPDVDTKISPVQLARVLGVSDLYDQGFRGAGMTLGVIGAAAFRPSDLQSMWQSFGINRQTPLRRDTMEPQQFRNIEAMIDTTLGSALAMDANVIYYSGPDSSDTSLLYTFNEAIGMAEAQVLTDSFDHAEATTSGAVARSYNESAMMAAALGMTLVAAAGDSVEVDTPSGSPYLTAVGGTVVTMDAAGDWLGEESWGNSGCGFSKQFDLPAWQKGVISGSNSHRAVADVAVPQGPFWTVFEGQWVEVDGSSSASPVFAGLLTVVNHYRTAQGRPPLGYLNPLLYTSTAVQGAFRDIVMQGTGGCATAPGWDMATGIGSPKALELAQAMP